MSPSLASFTITVLVLPVLAHTYTLYRTPYHRIPVVHHSEMSEMPILVSTRNYPNIGAFDNSFGYGHAKRSLGYANDDDFISEPSRTLELIPVEIDLEPEIEEPEEFEEPEEPQIVGIVEIEEQPEPEPEVELEEVELVPVQIVEEEEEEVPEPRFAIVQIA